ncbi:MAG: cytochrome b N-terminal domain-containing protein [Alphaproteobacteria bacterium]|nr:cytochrome b N-terminal domain-containing protein [Alphaproteobacteria bacterium]
MRAPLRAAFDRAEAALDGVFTAAWNPLLNLGALGFFFYWIITVSGIYLFIFFDTGVHQAYASVEYMTHDQWYAAGVMRSLHRYASDGLVVVMLLHLVREFALDRYRGVRWFSWVTGVPVLVLVFVAGISGYWMVWDQLAQYVALVSTEWLDRLPIFGEPIAKNFFSPDTLESRFFTLMVFLHIAVPLIALIVLWVHLQRVTKPRINPPRGLAVGVFASMLLLSLVHPALSQGAADLAQVPGRVGLDWFYLPLFPLLDRLPGTVTWVGAGVLLLMLVAVPWMPPMRRVAAAVVDLRNCNGCIRCFDDCPYNAIMMGARTDGRPFERQAIVNPALCVGCGICAGSCPTSMPFRTASDLAPGIDLPDHSMAMLRDAVHAASAALSGDTRVLVFGCEHGARIDSLASPHARGVSLRCVGQLPPSFLDYVLSRDLADGVVLAGCSTNSCHARKGIDWTEQRLARKRDPQLRARVPLARLRTHWQGRKGRRSLDALIEGFTTELARLPAPVRSARPGEPMPATERVDG